MSFCRFCSNKIPNDRIGKYHKNITIYCSDICNKRAYYVRKKEYVTSHLDPNTYIEWLKTETGKGRTWEIFIANLIQGKTQKHKSHFDILANNQKIEVKSCNLYKRPYKRGKPVKNRINQTGWWVFHRGIKETEINYFFCIGLIDNKPIKIFKIPGEEIKKGITISPIKSKFDKYIFHIN